MQAWALAEMLDKHFGSRVWEKVKVIKSAGKHLDLRHVRIPFVSVGAYCFHAHLIGVHMIV